MKEHEKFAALISRHYFQSLGFRIWRFFVAACWWVVLAFAGTAVTIFSLPLFYPVSPELIFVGVCSGLIACKLAGLPNRNKLRLIKSMLTGRYRDTFCEMKSLEILQNPFSKDVLRDAAWKIHNELINKEIEVMNAYTRCCELLCGQVRRRNGVFDRAEQGIRNRSLDRYDRLLHEISKAEALASARSDMDVLNAMKEAFDEAKTKADNVIAMADALYNERWPTSPEEWNDEWRMITEHRFAVLDSHRDDTMRDLERMQAEIGVLLEAERSKIAVTH